LRAEADEAEAGGGEDGRAHVHAHLDDDCRDAVGKHVDEGDAGASRAQRARGLDEDVLAERERLALHEPDVAGPPHQRDGDHGVDDAGPSAPTIAIASTRAGTDRKMSVTRMMISPPTPRE
jgi:hypothetical protein